MQEIIKLINGLSLNTPEEETIIYDSLKELKSALIQNGDVSKNILNNLNFLICLKSYAEDS